MPPPLPTKIALEIVTPVQQFEHEVDEVVLPGVEGEFGVLPGHTPLLAVLQTGRMWYRQGKEKRYLAVSMGFAEVLPDRVTVLAQVAEDATQLDTVRAEEGMKRAEEWLPVTGIEIDFERARLALLRTLQELRAVDRKL
jgi:F-type H+-transporting ATPase subunit epsilon